MAEAVYVTRTAAFLPHAPVDNEGMERVLGIPGHRTSRVRRVVLRQNGIVARHYVVDPATGIASFNNAQLTAQAVQRLCGDGFALSDLRCLVAGTSLPDQLMPNHAVMVHGEIGGPNCEVVATAGVCLAGLAALKYAWLALRSGEHPNAIATGSEIASLMMRAQRYVPELERPADDLAAHAELAFEKDFLRWMLSDAAGAFLLEHRPRGAGPSLRIDWIDMFSYANELPVCMYAGAEKDSAGRLRSWLDFSHEELGERSVLALKQDVRLLNEKVVEYCLVRPLRTLIQRRGLEADAIRWFLPHLSSRYFAAPAEEGLKRVGLPIPRARWFTNLETRGNTGSASMFLMVHDLCGSGRLQRGDRVLCMVPESGRFSTGAMHLTVV
ncbi:MAG TPA: beta-ketoacyl-ACP synthase III [Burkholderiaceae bacterium]|nr:beta-ketoacyl-ACP synthase III [Burkholderiaceae bacterium]